MLAASPELWDQIGALSYAESVAWLGTPVGVREGGGTLDSIPISARNEHEMRELLCEKMSRRPVPRLAKFHEGLLECTNRLLDWRLWEAADLLHPQPCSGDTFADFRLWIVAQGSQTYESVVNDPDALALVPEIIRLAALPQPWADEDYPHFPSLGTVASDAFEVLLKKLRPDVARSVERPDVLDEQIQAYFDEPYPADYGADEAVHHRLPRLSALRGRVL